MAAFIDEDMTILHINTLVFRASSANVEQPAVIPILFLQKMKDLRHVLMVCVLHVLKLCLCVHRPHKFPCASRVRRFLPSALFPGF